MSQTTRTITFSLAPEIADRVEEIVKQQGCSRSELLHEALLRYIDSTSGGSFSSTESKR